jgi:hypothetical protein
LLAGVVALAACQVETRSDAFRCELPADCTGGRVCVDGWCVVGDGGLPPDGGGPDGDPPDAMVCPPSCTTCAAGRCIIQCDEVGACSAEVVCPPGIPCTVECTGAGSCGGGVDCSTASDCDIECVSPTSCGGAIACGTGPCLVRCTAMDTCGSNIDCSDACACDVECTGTGSCAANELCPGGGACDPGQGCTSAPNPCHFCP